VSHSIASRWATVNYRVRADLEGPSAGVWAERALIYAELTNDPAIIHGALNIVAINVSNKSLGRAGRALHREGVEFARQNGLSYQLTMSLNNVALMDAVAADLPSAVATLAEAIDLGISSGGHSAVIYPMAARVEYLTQLGRISEALEQVAVGTDLFGEPTRATLIEQGEFLVSAAWARSIAGEPNDESLFETVREVTENDLDSHRTGSNLLHQYAEVAQRPDRAAIARQAVLVEFEAGGVNDGLPSQWPRGADTNLDAEDWPGLRSMFDYLPELGGSPVDRMLACQVRRMRASLEALDQASTMPRVEVEVLLRTSIEELAGLGMIVERGRTLAVLARFLDAIGRSTGARAARDEAAALLREHGAFGLLRKLDLH
jgi:hypothetical protein